MINMLFLTTEQQLLGLTHSLLIILVTYLTKTTLEQQVNMAIDSLLLSKTLYQTKFVSTCVCYQILQLVFPISLKLVFVFSYYNYSRFTFTIFARCKFGRKLSKINTINVGCCWRRHSWISRMQGRKL